MCIASVGKIMQLCRYSSFTSKGLMIAQLNRIVHMQLWPTAYKVKLSNFLGIRYDEILTVEKISIYRYSVTVLSNCFQHTFHNPSLYFEHSVYKMFELQFIKSCLSMAWLRSIKMSSLFPLTFEIPFPVSTFYYNYMQSNTKKEKWKLNISCITNRERGQLFPVLV